LCGNAEHCLFAKRWRKHLHANRHVVRACTEWNAHCAVPSKVGWNGEDVAEIHRQWVVGFFTDGERNSWRRWRKDDITRGIRRGEIIGNEPTNF
jgi:hypothetical protein